MLLQVLVLLSTVLLTSSKRALVCPRRATILFKIISGIFSPCLPNDDDNDNDNDNDNDDNSDDDDDDYDNNGSTNASNNISNVISRQIG